jgi:hypothetical protein
MRPASLLRRFLGAQPVGCSACRRWKRNRPLKIAQRAPHQHEALIYLDEYVAGCPAQALFSCRTMELLPLSVNTGLASGSPVAGVAAGGSNFSRRRCGRAGATSRDQCAGKRVGVTLARPCTTDRVPTSPDRDPQSIVLTHFCAQLLRIAGKRQLRVARHLAVRVVDICRVVTQRCE